MEFLVDKHLRDENEMLYLFKRRGKHPKVENEKNTCKSKEHIFSTHPVAIHKSVIAAAELVKRRPLPANQKAALSHCFNNLNRANLRWRF